MKVELKNILYWCVIIIVMIGCYPNDGITVEEADIVGTNYDAAYFESNTPMTYHLPDTVGVIGSINPEDQDLTRDQMDFILNQIRLNFTSLGYTHIESSDFDTVEPDVVVTVDNIVNTTVGVGGCYPSYWSWWSWYPWYPGWGWGGWCYPSYAYSYTTGTLIITMIDGDDSSEEAGFLRVWDAGINGLVRSNQQGNEDFVTKTVDQAFTQSPYLSTSN